MAIRQVLVDDIDGSESDSVETVLFGFEGLSYEIDQHNKNRDALAEALAPFLAHARRVEQSVSAKPRTKPQRDYDPKVVREWAKG